MRLVGIMLVVFRRTDSQVHVPQSSVHSARLPTGIQLISRMGNKVAYHPLFNFSFKYDVWQ